MTISKKLAVAIAAVSALAIGVGVYAALSLTKTASTGDFTVTVQADTQFEVTKYKNTGGVVSPASDGDSSWCARDFGSETGEVFCLIGIENTTPGLPISYDISIKPKAGGSEVLQQSLLAAARATVNSGYTTSLANACLVNKDYVAAGPNLVMEAPLAQAPEALGNTLQEPVATTGGKDHAQVCVRFRLADAVTGEPGTLSTGADIEIRGYR